MNPQLDTIDHRILGILQQDATQSVDAISDAVALSRNACWRRIKAITAMPEITSAQRMTGDLDYVLQVQLADVAAYDLFYKRLTSRISVSDISASFVMENIKHTTALPL